MKVTRRFRVRDTGESPRYRLEVEEALVGSCDFLGIEESLPAGHPDTVLNLMIRAGVQRTSATAFLWQLLEERKKRQESGAALAEWEEAIESEC